LKSIYTLVRIGIPTLLIVFFASFLFYFSTQAASLTAVYIYLSRMEANLTGAAGQEVELILAVTPATSMASGGTVTIEFPDDQDGEWCRGAGALTPTGVTASAVDTTGGAGNWDIDSALPGTLASTCTAGVGAGSVDTIEITGLTALTAGTTYGVKVVSATGVIGTGATAGQHELTVTVSSGAVIDSKTFKIQLIADDQVVISATVSSAPSVTCSISANTVNLGTLYPGGAYAVGSHTISTTTSIAGYYWAAYGQGDGGTLDDDAGLYKSTSTTDLLASGPTATLDLTVAGSEGFGLTATDPDTGGSAVVSTNFVAGTPGTFGTIDRLYAGAKMIITQPDAQASAEQSTITYGARAASGAQAGSYQETVTWVCGGYY